MLDNLKKYRIILGSNSPRRQELLKGIRVDFEVIPTDADEHLPAHIQGIEVAGYLAERKADSYKHIITEQDLLITADTIVLYENRILGKPHNKQEATEMLHFLSGKTHQVVTGVCISTINRRHIFHTVTEVKFSNLTEEEIDYYIENYKPYDKAGAYGVQEWIGFIAVEHINGSYFNVMGLPIQKLYQELKKW
ncbi:MAG TPA: Maf-like protein [Paludibacter sp.]|nr:Maf-like protein [Paludibacter sp.]HOS45940.1 Maf-like protein [Paludibacter sp.]HPM10440.1 Maf-like protein [Paludibacter sp.]